MNANCNFVYVKSVIFLLCLELVAIDNRVLNVQVLNWTPPKFKMDRGR